MKGKPEATPHPSDSSAQREAERIALEMFSREYGQSLVPQRLILPDGSSVQVDGFFAAPQLCSSKCSRIRVR